MKSMILVRVSGNLNLLTRRLVLCYRLFLYYLHLVQSPSLTNDAQEFMAICHSLYLWSNLIVPVLVFALVIGPHEQERFMAVLVDPIPYGKEMLPQSAYYFPAHMWSTKSPPLPREKVQLVISTDQEGARFHRQMLIILFFKETLYEKLKNKRQHNWG